MLRQVLIAVILDAFAEDLVESLPTGLDVVVGHSLGGSVLERAVGRLAPAGAVYLDPGFRLGLPTAGLAGRLFWATAPVGLAVAALAQRWRSRGRPAPSPEDARLRDAATARFDRGMAVGVFRDVAHAPAPVAPPVVPSLDSLTDHLKKPAPPPSSTTPSSSP